MLSGRVLIAASDPELRRNLFRELLDLDVFCDTASSLERVVESLRRRYTVVLLDLAFAAESDTVLDVLRAIPVEARPFVLAIADDVATRSADLDIAQILLRKTTSSREIAEIIRGCVRSAQSGRHLRALFAGDSHPLTGDQPD